MSVPGPWAFALLAFAAFRVFWLIGEDAILDRPRAFVTANGRRETLTLFLSCPWCCGAWCSLAWWLAWTIGPHWTLVVAVPFALSAVVGAVTTGLHRLADG